MHTITVIIHVLNQTPHAKNFGVRWTLTIFTELLVGIMYTTQPHQSQNFLHLPSSPHTVFNSSTCSSDFRSPNCCRNATWEGNVFGSRKLSRLNSSSTLFCSGVPVRSTLCSRSRLFSPSRSLQFLFLSR